MFSEQRQAFILDWLNQSGSVRSQELVETLGISTATVRRDLSELEEQGLLKRTHGGAVSLTSALFERAYGDAAGKQGAEKKAIAQIAASLVAEGETVLLDSGTTTHEIARQLANKEVTLITNSMTLPPEDMPFRPTLLLTGGHYRSHTQACVGPHAQALIRSVRPDKAFIGANGIVDMEFTTPHASEAAIKQLMIEVSKEKYLVADHTKFQKRSLSVVGSVSVFNALITDDGVTEDTASFYRTRFVPLLTPSTFEPEQKGAAMDISEIMKPDLIELAVKATQKEDAIHELIALLHQHGVIDEKQDLFQAVMEREAAFSTGIGMGIAIPHAKCACVKKAAIAFGRSDQGVRWTGEEETTAHLIFLIVVPIEAQNQHLRLLAQISRKLVHESVRQKIMQAQTAEQVLQALNA